VRTFLEKEDEIDLCKTDIGRGHTKEGLWSKKQMLQDVEKGGNTEGGV